MLEDDSPQDTPQSIRLLFTATPRRMASLPLLAQQVGEAMELVCRCQCAPLATAHDGLTEHSADAIVIVLDPLDDTGGLTSLLDQCDQHDLPRFLLTDRHSRTQMGLEAMDAAASPEVIAATLRGMLSQRPYLQRLKQQASNVKGILGGLRSDMARMQDELQLAAQVQREFLPKSLPDLPRARMAVMWRPASWVSGDMYDTRRLDEHHLGLFVADAVGHGVPAALMTMVISRSLPTKEIQGNSYRIVPPAEALAKVNMELLKRHGRDTRFATAVYAVLDLRTLRLRVACAGHPAPIVLRGRNTIEMVHGKGGVLGVFEDEVCENVEVDLNPGDRLLLYSDGFEAAFLDDSASPGVGRDALGLHMDAFRSMLAVDEPEDIIKRLGERIDRGSTDSAHVDDITLLALKVS